MVSVDEASAQVMCWGSSLLGRPGNVKHSCVWMEEKQMPAAADLDPSQRAVFVSQLKGFKLKLQPVVARRWPLPAPGFETSTLDVNQCSLSFLKQGGDSLLSH